MWCCLFFFFKQKTAYEMRISDWSSDVCSSDLHGEKTMIIKRIDVLSAGKISGIIAAAIGLIAGLVFLVFGSMIAGLAGPQEGSGLIAMGGGIIGVVALTIMYGIFAFIGGVIHAFLYKLAAGFANGRAHI